MQPVHHFSQFVFDLLLKEGPLTIGAGLFEETHEVGESLGVLGGRVEGHGEALRRHVQRLLLVRRQLVSVDLGLEKFEDRRDK